MSSGFRESPSASALRYRKGEQLENADPAWGEEGGKEGKKEGERPGIDRRRCNFYSWKYYRNEK